MIHILAWTIVNVLVGVHICARALAHVTIL